LANIAAAASIIRVIMLMMETASTSEMLVNFYQTTQHKNPETAIFILAAVRTSISKITVSKNLIFGVLENGCIGLNGKFLRFRRDGPFLKRLVTCNKKWIFYDNVIQKRQWCRPEEAPKPTPKKNLHSKKLMICVWWDMERIYTSSYDPTKP
jgi:hypothetical protein